jgi:hypothetical protein
LIWSKADVFKTVVAAILDKATALDFTSSSGPNFPAQRSKTSDDGAHRRPLVARRFKMRKTCIVRDGPKIRHSNIAKCLFQICGTIQDPTLCKRRADAREMRGRITEVRQTLRSTAPGRLSYISFESRCASVHIAAAQSSASARASARSAIVVTSPVKANPA